MEMSEWKEYRLGELIKTNCRSIDKNYPYSIISYLDTGSITCNKISELQNFNLKEAPSRAKRLVIDEDIIYSTVRPNQLHYGFIKQPNENLVVSTGFTTITCNKAKILPKFLYYNLIQNHRTEYLHSIAEASTSAYPSLKPIDLEELEITLPPLPEQKAIASVLSSLDDKIDLLHRQNATLEKMAETLFRQWFVEEAKEEAKEDSEEGILGEFITETVGGEWGKDIACNDFLKPVKCLRGTDIADLNNGLADKAPIRFIKEQKFKKIDPKEGDLILEISGGTETQSTGRVTYINNGIKSLFDYPLIFSNFCRLLRIKKEEYTFFLYCYLKYLYKQDEFFTLENGSSGIKNLNYKALLYELSFPLPINREKIIDFHKQVKTYFIKINCNKQQIRTLTSLRDTLLPKLMSGEIKVEI